MSTSGFDDRELQLMLVALRYWRAHRADGNTRRGDPHLGPEQVDQLLSKLSAALPPSERDSRQRGLFAPEGAPATAHDTGAVHTPADRKSGPSRR